ncbi:hypothetical protein EW146_g540 [Bondarzewia mesenterica]|uniref:Uncharacterized protein n=1 Tax=Bondarzewia mesenterica TaxID=1095465 RepID=A0A4S4M720_9AGAM|nr:hypothetical protein EW146_g540 [Bondarzewia mesenterica]
MRSSSIPPTKRHSHHSSHPGKYSPSSRAADISRLLDPTYSSSSTSSSPTSVYVDHHGDLHDPDFRDFPVVHPRDLATRRRPAWERGFDDDDDLSTTPEEDEIDGDAFDDRVRLHSVKPREHRRHSRDHPRRSHTIPSYNYSYAHTSSLDEPRHDIEEEHREKRLRRKLCSKSETRRESAAWIVEEEHENHREAEQEPKTEYVPTHSETPDWT